MNTDLINDALLRLCPGLLFQWLPGGKTSGSSQQEYIVRNPVRQDSRPGSFSINTHTGAWADFATGDKGKTLVSLSAYLHHESAHDAARRLELEYGLNGSATPFAELLKNATAGAEPEILMPVPANAPPPPIPAFATGCWEYRNTDNELLGYVYRSDPAGQRKQFCPLVYTSAGWKKKAFPKPQPLYGLPQLVSRPDACVILVEGEKAADAGLELFDDAVTVSWPGGSSNIGSIDWKPLAGRTVFALPDYDAVGIKAMTQIAETVGRIADIRVLTLPDDTPEKWDIADGLAAGWQPHEAQAWLNAVLLKNSPGQIASEGLSDFKLVLPDPLQAVADWVLATSARPQPVFAIQGALALGSVLMGRKYRSDQNNYPSLYFVNVGPSTCGKEHIKTALEAILESAGLETLMGPSGYTSAAGVLSHLQAKPTHLTIIDELGAFLRASKQTSNSMKSEALTQLIECFGRLHGTIRPLGYSQQTGAAQQAADEKRLPVIRPALTLLAMTTPGTLFDNLTMAQVESGLINRLIIAETDRGRVVSQRVCWTPPSHAIIDWAKSIRFIGGGNLSILPDMPCNTPPEPRVIPFSAKANQLWDDFDVQLMGEMDGLENEGMAPMLGRTREKAMRMSLILAGCQNPDCASISEEWSEQARDYILEKDRKAVECYRGRVAESEFGRLYNAILDCVKKGGTQGRTDRELGQYCRVFRDKKPGERSEALQALQNDGQIERVSLPSLRGKGRDAWLIKAVDEDE